MTKFRLTQNHFDMKKGTYWYDAGSCVPQPGDGPSRVVTEIEGDRTEGCLRIVPETKLEKVDEDDIPNQNT
jgi:hypothetical protein